jgi:hypothetical protein
MTKQGKRHQAKQGQVMRHLSDQDSSRFQPSDLWSAHEHVAPSVELEAKKLLMAAGTSELAKHAIDFTSGSEATDVNKANSLAEAMGFHSYRSLLESSTPGRKRNDRHWFLTSLRPNEWILWNDRDLEVAGVFESSREAAAAIP